MSKHTLTLNLPTALKHAQQRVLEGTEIVVPRAGGYTGELTDKELEIAKADPYINVDVKKAEAPKAEGGDKTPKEPKQPKEPKTPKEPKVPKTPEAPKAEGGDKTEE